MFNHYVFILIICCLSVLSTPAQATDAGDAVHADVIVHLEAGQVYCDAYSTAQAAQVRQLLTSGAIVSSSWQFNIKYPRTYWLNKTLANQEIIHQVTPDLLTHSWSLLDLASGTTRATPSLSEAVAFLLSMKHVPIIEIKLLQRERVDTNENRPPFILHTRLHIRDGTLSFNRWTYPFRLGKTVKKQTFHLL